MRNFYQEGYDFFKIKKDFHFETPEFKKLNILILVPGTTLASYQWQKFNLGHRTAKKDFVRPYKENFYKELQEFNKRLDINLCPGKEEVLKLIDGVYYDIS